jgi:uracil-DNA glycosylase family 4
MDKASSKKSKEFSGLVKAAAACTVCESMCGRSAVLGPLNGNIAPKVMFIAEAPGRQGADRTRRPFYGDKSGDHFQRLLDSIGLTRDEVFITNTVLCSPRSETGANRKPTKTEIKNCSGFLRETIALIDPPIVVSLGSVALEALKSIEYHQLSLKENVASRRKWHGRMLIPLYHPSPQVLAAVRRADEQLVDFKAVERALAAVAKATGGRQS